MFGDDGRNHMRTFIVLISVLFILSAVEPNYSNGIDSDDPSSDDLPTTGTSSITFSGGDGSKSDPYQISNVTQLQAMNGDLTAHYVLNNDINASATKDWNNEAGFIPVANDTDLTLPGFQGEGFTGSLDGKGYNITGLCINRSGYYSIGLFGLVEYPGEVRNLSLWDSMILGSAQVGALASLVNGKVINCHSSGEVRGKSTVGGLIGNLHYHSKHYDTSGYVNRSSSSCFTIGSDYIGGLIGYCWRYINDCWATGDVVGSSRVGGLVGDYNFGIATNCSATGNVSGTKSGVGGFAGNTGAWLTNCHAYGKVKGSAQSGSVGGFIGYAHGGKFLNCSSWGSVFGGREYVGGFIGRSISATINGCVSYGDVRSYRYGLGGFVGQNYKGTIRNCYSVGDVTGVNYAGGFVGENGYVNTPAYIYDSYCLGNITTGDEDTTGAFIGNNRTGVVSGCFVLNESLDLFHPVGLGTYSDIWTLKVKDMVNRTTFTNVSWDLNETWGISDGHTTPYLRWQENNRPILTTEDQKIATKGAVYHFDQEFKDEDPTDLIPIWDLVTDADWLTIDQEGVLVGVPGALDLGPYYVNVSVDDGRSGIDWHNFTLTINTTNTAPEIITSNDLFAHEDHWYMRDYQCVEDTGDDLEWTCSTDADWIELSGVTGVLSGTPLMEDIGSYSVNITVHDGQGAVEWTEFTLSVNETNDDPVIISDDITVGWETFFYANQYAATDEENDALTWGLNSNATWLSINDTTGFLMGEPLSGDNGTYFVNVTLQDSRGGSTWSNFTLDIFRATGTGSKVDPVLIWNITQIQMIEMGLDRHYRIINDIDATETKGWNNGEGFRTVGLEYNYYLKSERNEFKGSLDGGGFNITGLSINRPEQENVAIFYELDENSKVKNLSLTDINITALYDVGSVAVNSRGGTIENVHVSGLITSRTNDMDSENIGGIVGYNGGHILSCSVDIDISGYRIIGGMVGTNYGSMLDSTFSSTIDGINQIGGMVGKNYHGLIRNCSGDAHIDFGSSAGGMIGYCEGDVIDCSVYGRVNGTDGVGGLAGWIEDDVKVEDCISFVNVSGINHVGGLAGMVRSPIYRSVHIGNVSGESYTGGLVGYTYEPIENCYTEGSVTGTLQQTGGLIGRARGDVIQCYSTCNVSGRVVVGGLCGSSQYKVNRSFSMGPVQSLSYAGGLIGQVGGSVEDCYSTSRVNGTSRIGGLIGEYYGESIRRSFSIGNVSGDFNVGGFVGDYRYINKMNCFWDMQTSNQNDSRIAVGLNTSEMIQRGTYADAGWDLNNTWNIADNMTYPYLRWYSPETDPVIDSIDIETATEDEAFTVNYSGHDDDVLDVVQHWILETNATWLTMDPVDGILNGTPENGDVGSYWVNITFIDGRGGMDFRNFSLVVENQNDDPLLIGDPNITALEDMLFEGFFSSMDIDPTMDVLSISMMTNASWLDLDSITGRIHGTPVQEDIGTYWVNMTVTDGRGGKDWNNFTIEVLNTNDAPIFAVEQIPNATEDIQFNFTVLCFDPDPTGDSLRWALNDTDLETLTLDHFTGNISFLPGNNDVGEHWVLITVWDEHGLSITRNFTFFVINVNDDPWVQEVNDRTIMEDEPFWVQMEGRDFDPTEDTLTWSMAMERSFLEIDPVTGNLTGFPQEEDVGVWSVTVFLEDGNGGNYSIVFDLTVIQVNEGPKMIGENITITMDEDSDETYLDLSLYVYDEEGDDITFYPFFNENFTVTISDVYMIMIMPVPDFKGEDIILIDANDGSKSTIMSIRVIVENINDPPRIMNVQYPDTAKDNETLILRCEVIDPEGDDFSVRWDSSISGPIGEGIEIGISLIAGLHNITVTVSDGSGAESERSFEIHVESSASDNPVDDDDDSDSEKEGGSGIWVIGVVLLIILVIITSVLIIFMRSKKKNKEKKEVATDQQIAVPQPSGMDRGIGLKPPMAPPVNTLPPQTIPIQERGAIAPPTNSMNTLPPQTTQVPEKGPNDPMIHSMNTPPPQIPQGPETGSIDPMISSMDPIPPPTMEVQDHPVIEGQLSTEPMKAVVNDQPSPEPGPEPIVDAPIQDPEIIEKTETE